jgi:hypothetical protein
MRRHSSSGQLYGASVLGNGAVITASTRRIVAIAEMCATPGGGRPKWTKDVPGEWASSGLAGAASVRDPHFSTIEHNWMAGVKLGLVFAMTRPSIAGLLALASLGSSFGQSPETLQLNSVSLQTSIAVEIRLFSAAKDMVVPYCSEGEGGSLRLCNLAVRLERESRNEWRRVGLRTHTQARSGRRAYGEICRQDIDSRVNFHPRVPVPWVPS